MKPLAITMGDASGVGPEILLRRAAAQGIDHDTLVYGDLAILEAGAKQLGLNLSLHGIAHPSQAVPGKLNVVDCQALSVAEWTPGKLSGAAGAAARQYVLRATRDSLDGHLAGLVTLPMNKEATQLSDPRFCGHTELIAEACGVEDYTMMLACPQVACAHVSTHCSLADAIKRCTAERVSVVIQLLHQALARFIEKPRIAVCGLNPHAGEHGLFGNEDEIHIRPAVEAAAAKGWQVFGPLPGDTVFYQAVQRKRYDGIIAIYHDQGHAPMKLLAFEDGVNITLGLPIIRTSVDHGTAFDIAWQGKAFTHSLDHALQYGRQLRGDAA